MKIAILISCLILSLVAVLVTLVSARTYNLLFAIGVVLALFSIVGFIYLARISANYRRYTYVLSILPLYVMLDITFRYCWGVRISDFLR